MRLRPQLMLAWTLKSTINLVDNFHVVPFLFPLTFVGVRSNGNSLHHTWQTLAYILHKGNNIQTKAPHMYLILATHCDLEVTKMVQKVWAMYLVSSLCSFMIYHVQGCSCRANTLAFPLMAL